jgi:YVTN family beta-propeller protein
MHGSNGSRAARVGGFAALWGALALVLAFSARPAEATPFAYVVNESDGTVSVMDTTTNKVVATVTVGGSPTGVAVTPDGKHVYVANNANVLVIDTSNNTVVGTPITVGNGPVAVAVTPKNGQYVYVANSNLSNTVSVIDTATNTVVDTINVGGSPAGVAVTQDGKHAYVTAPGYVSVIETGANKEVAKVTAGLLAGVAVTPNGKYVYVANKPINNVLVIDTTTNKVVATVTVGGLPTGVAVTPDGKHVYVANQYTNNVSVIDTTTNKVVATVMVGAHPPGVAIVPP